MSGSWLLIINFIKMTSLPKFRKWNNSKFFGNIKKRAQKIPVFIYTFLKYYQTTQLAKCSPCPNLSFDNAKPIMTKKHMLTAKLIFLRPRIVWFSKRKSRSSLPFTRSTAVRCLYSFWNFLLSRPTLLRAPLKTHTYWRLISNK